MSVTVSYKGDTLATVSNETKKLDTKAMWMEDDITLTDSTTRVQTIEVERDGAYSISFPVDGEPTQITIVLTAPTSQSSRLSYGILSGLYDGTGCYLYRFVAMSGGSSSRISYDIENATYSYSNGTVTIAPVSAVSANSFVEGTYVVTYSYEP